MAAHSAAQSVVAGQQSYARDNALARIFEDLTTAVIYARPEDPASFIAAEAQRMAEAGDGYRAAPVNGEIDTEEAAAAYLEQNRVQPMLEELFALTLVSKPAEPLAFIQQEALKLQQLRAEQKPSAMFSEEDLLGMFSLFDPTSSNSISADQARTALRNLGIKDVTPTATGLPEAGGARIDSKAFLAAARAALDRERTL